MSEKSAGKVHRGHPGLAPGMCLIVVLLAGCGDDGDPAAETADGPGNPPRVEGAVLAPAERRAAGLVPLEDVQVSLFRVGGSGEAIEPALQTASTDADGAYAFESLPEQGLLMLQAAADTAVLRAYVSGGRVDVTPASELVVRRVTAVIDDTAPLSNFSRAELAAASGYLLSLPMADADGFEATLEALDAAAGPLFTEILTAYAGAGVVSALRSGSYGAVEFGVTLRDPGALESEDLAGGVDVGSGIGMMSFGDVDDAATSPAFLARELLLLEPDGAVRSSTRDEVLAPTDDLSGLLHVPAANGQLLVVDAAGGAAAIPGVLPASGALMIYPLGAADNSGAFAAAGEGLRFAARWFDPSAVEPNTRLDPLGGEPTLYHLMHMFLSFAGDGEPAMTVGAGSGAVVFDSSPQSRAFAGDAGERNFGDFAMSAGRAPLTLTLGDYAVSQIDPGGASPAAGLYRVVAGTGLLELRGDSDGAPLGAGVLTADGEIVAMQTAAVAEAGAMERGFAIAVRRANDVVPPIGGVYNLFEYAVHIAGDGEDPPETAFVVNVLRHGVVRLDADDGVVGEAMLLRRESRLDMASARAGGGAAIERVMAAEALAFPGTFSVDGSGAVSVELALQREGDEAIETLLGAGAADSSGDFIALAVRGAGRDQGRGLLFLVRQNGR